MEQLEIALSSSALVVSAAALARSIYRLYWAAMAERMLRYKLCHQYQQVVVEWSKRLEDYDDSSCRKVQKELERIAVKSLDEAALAQLIDALHQPSEAGRERYVRRLVAESQPERSMTAVA
jgi:hypothetical protein